MGIFFAILSPAIYGINNYIDKFFLGKFNISPVVISIYGGIAGFLTGAIILFFAGFYQADFKSVIIILASGFLTNLYILPYFKALQKDEASRIIPLFQFTPIFVLILSFMFLGEALRIGQYAGAILIISGAFLISLQKLDFKMFNLRPSFWYMLLSSFIFAVSMVLYKFGVKEIPFWHTLPLEGFGMALGALAIYLYKNNGKNFIKETRNFSRNVYGLMFINEAVYILARYTAYFALSLITASIVNILFGFQQIFVLIYGIILSLWSPRILKEVINKKVIAQKVASIIIIFVGLYFIFV